MGEDELQLERAVVLDGEHGHRLRLGDAVVGEDDVGAADDDEYVAVEDALDLQGDVAGSSYKATMGSPTTDGRSFVGPGLAPAPHGP